MDVNVINELQNGLSAAYINGSVAANLAYKPAFVSNNPEEGKKVISSVEDELLRCDEFQISVAFITMGGVTPLLQTLKELGEKGIKGQILTTNYLNFSEPRALEKLNSLKNVTLKMYDVEAAGNGFHTKGYIFKKAWPLSTPRPTTQLAPVPWALQTKRRTSKWLLSTSSTSACVQPSPTCRPKVTLEQNRTLAHFRGERNV